MKLQVLTAGTATLYFTQNQSITQKRGGLTMHAQVHFINQRAKLLSSPKVPFMFAEKYQVKHV